VADLIHVTTSPIAYFIDLCFIFAVYCLQNTFVSGKSAY